MELVKYDNKVEFMTNLENDYKIFNFKSNEIVIFGKFAIHIIDVFNWAEKLEFHFQIN